ncbi:MAG: CoA-acylating methylmalonate-semialdehyde dehydrogenase [Candidatus Riflebacteria bacterium]|nr:CoA-acylating methylmalonate-semialdehyde dehydrogenase [Candidatus Riflebacteria bacterium]
MKTVKNYIDGAWKEPSGKESQDVVDPGTGEIVAKVRFSTSEEVNGAVKAAREAFREWRMTPPVTRARYMFKLKSILEERFDEAAKICSMEVGKTLEESRGEVRRSIEVVEAMAGIPTLMKGQALEDIAAGIDCSVYRQPIGVFAAIAPFNFPFMVPLWFLPPAIATGNTFIVKPSEQVPLSQQMVFEILDELNLPSGVVNLVNGGKDAANVLLSHPDVAGVSFVGATETAKYIYSEAARHGKRVQSLGGAKNFMLIMPDADIPATVNAIIGSSYGCAGQRCLAGSNIVAVGGIHDALVEALLAKSKALKTGYGLEADSQMGAIASKKSRDRILGLIEVGVKEGAKLLLDGRKVKVEKYPKGFYIGPTMFDEVTPQMTIAKEEIFGPVLNILRAKDFEEGMRMIEACPYANAGSIFTASGKMAREFGYRLPASMCGINIGIAAPMSFFSFGGSRNSFFGDLKAHGQESVDFYTDRKVISSRWF